MWNFLVLIFLVKPGLNCISVYTFVIMVLLDKIHKCIHTIRRTVDGHQGIRLHFHRHATLTRLVHSSSDDSSLYKTVPTCQIYTYVQQYITVGFTNQDAQCRALKGGGSVLIPWTLR